jgi:hypothetical protein
MVARRLATLPKFLPLPGRSRGRVRPVAKLLNQSTSDTWRPWIGPRANIPLATNMTHVQCSFVHICQLSTTQPYHVSYGLPRQQPYRLYGLYSQRPFFFTCVSFRTECDISRSRRLFEPKRVALGSQRRDLFSRSI